MNISDGHLKNAAQRICVLSTEISFLRIFKYKLESLFTYAFSQSYLKQEHIEINPVQCFLLVLTRLHCTLLTGDSYNPT
jgi:hypothetical protein